MDHKPKANHIVNIYSNAIKATLWTEVLPRKNYKTFLLRHLEGRHRHTHKGKGKAIAKSKGKAKAKNKAQNLFRGWTRS